jgi:uncharacterized protein
MEFNNEFDVKAPIDEVWDAVLDVERVAPCVPGAEVLERTGDDAYKVGIKVKVGPMSMQYRGEVEIVEKDPEAHRAVMSAKAREARGQGTANANVVMNLSGNGGGTHGSIATDVQLSGKAAAMGQGVIQDVSGRIVDQFAQNLAAMLAGAPAPEEAGAVGAAEAEAAAAAPSPPRPAPPAEEGLDVLPIVKSVAEERARDPRVFWTSLGIAFLIGLLLGRGRRRS